MTSATTSKPNPSLKKHSPSWLRRYDIAESELAAVVSPTWCLGKGGATEGAY